MTQNNGYNPLFDRKWQQINVDPQVQKTVINEPKSDPQGVSPEDETFLSHVLDLISKGTIQLWVPSSLLNNKVYDDLNPEQQAKVEMEAQNLVAKLRNIKDLNDAGYRGSFQMNNLVRSVRLVKERIEQIRGDVFII